MSNIKVTSPSFSQHPVLAQRLLKHFPTAVLNTEGKRYSKHELLDYLSDADGAIVGLEKLDAATLDQIKHIKILSKYGVGLDNIDLDHAKTLGITIGWQPGVNKRSVSELALCFMLGLCRNVFTSGLQLKAGAWNKNGGVQLSERTVGLVGCGFVGEDLLHLLKPFHCKIYICDVLDKSEVAQKYGATQVDLKTILTESDIVSLHVPLTKDTHKLIDQSKLALMKSNSFLINTSRGPIVDQNSLKQALLNKTIAGAALDVFEEEPPSDLDFLSLQNLMITPHIGGNAREAVEAMGNAAIDNLIHFFGRTS